MTSYVRAVRLLAAGGTIAMQGERAVPALDAQGLVDAVPALAAVPALRAETVLTVPSVHLTLAQALSLAQRAAAVAGSGEGVVISTGTDTLEEVGVLCALLSASEAPIVITGANRPASFPGADGPANLIDAVAVAGSSAATGLGAVVVFGGEIHDAMTVRKVDSTSPAAFGSPVSGPLGRVVDTRVWLHARPARPTPALAVDALSGRVEIVSPGLGDDGTLMRTAASGADGVVLVAFGAGHLTPGLLAALREVLDRIPVVITGRPDRASMLVETYGFEGAERDVRASGALCAPFLSPQAARIALLSCLGAGLDRGGMEACVSALGCAALGRAGFGEAARSLACSQCRRLLSGCTLCQREREAGRERVATAVGVLDRSGRRLRAPATFGFAREVAAGGSLRGDFQPRSNVLGPVALVAIARAVDERVYLGVALREGRARSRRNNNDSGLTRSLERRRVTGSHVNAARAVEPPPVEWVRAERVEPFADRDDRALATFFKQRERAPRPL